MSEFLQQTLENPGAGEFRRGWVILLCGIIGMTVQGAAFVSLGTMLVPLSAAFGWTRTAIVAVAPLSALVAPFVLPLTGTLVDRWGPRRVALYGFAIYAVAIAAMAGLGPNILGLWAIWSAIVVSNLLICALVWTTAVTRTFTTHRGLALGIVLSGMGLAVTIVPLFLGWATAAFGWRGAYLALSAAVLILGWGVTFICFRPPEHDPARAAALLAGGGMTRREAMQTGRFWKLGFSLLIASGAVGTLVIHLQSMLVDRGGTMLAAAAVAAAAGPAQIVGRLAGGYLLDRFSGPLLGAGILLLPIVGCLVLLLGLGNHPAAWLVPLCFGLAAGIELDLGSYLAARFFGAAHFGAIFSALFIFYIVGYTFGPLLAAYSRDMTGDYRIALIMIAALLPLAALLTATLGRYPDHFSSDLG